MKTFICALLLCAVGLSPHAALAHKLSDSYLRLQVTGAQIQGQWDIALRDLQLVMNFDKDGDNAISWGELRAQHADIAAYATQHLTLSTSGASCPINVDRQWVDRHADGGYTVLYFTADCPSTIKKLKIDYRLLFDLDRQHRGLLQLESAGLVRSAIFGPDQTAQRFSLAETGLLRQFIDYVHQGIWHIVIGYDHILFLITLLLPVVLIRSNTQWTPAIQFRTVVIQTLKIVTAFTLAHSLTLGLAATGLVNLPSRWVEIAIAVTVVAAALNNLFHWYRGPTGWLALGFGLIHGFGFAAVLGELGLPQSARVLSLLAFNVGVEIGQMLIVILLLPLLFWLRCSPQYPRWVLGAGSVGATAMGLIWILERSTSIRILTGV